MNTPNLRVAAFATMSIVLLAASAFTYENIREALSTRVSFEGIESSIDANMNSISQLVESLRTERAALERELALLTQNVVSAESSVDAPLDLLVQKAVEEIESKPEPETQVLFSYITPQAREATRELDVALLTIQAETTFGPFLDELGVSDPRRSAILEEIARAFFNVQEAGFMQMNNEITPQEAAAIRSENNALVILGTLLEGDADEAEIASYMRAREEGNSSRRVIEELYFRFQSTLPISDMHAFAELYQETVSAPGRATAGGQSSEIYEAQLEGIEQLRSSVSQQFGDEHALQLNAFLSSQEERIKQSISRQ